ncbi:E1 ubiquitin-activating enzyme [Ranunculus cassubicifolius]
MLLHNFHSIVEEMRTIKCTHEAILLLLDIMLWFLLISVEKAVEFDEYCRAQQPPIPFIKTEVRGLFGSVFCDFGPEFTVVDVDGEEPHSGIIASVNNDNPALVSCVDDERLEFQDGDLVMFSEVKGMTELNDGKPRKVKNARLYSFQLDEDTFYQEIGACIIGAWNYLYYWRFYWQRILNSESEKVDTNLKNVFFFKSTNLGTAFGL